LRGGETCHIFWIHLAAPDQWRIQRNDATITNILHPHKCHWSSVAMTNIANPHDAFFKQFLSKPEVAEDFLRQHLPTAILPLLNLSALTL
jgi:hypothetical protein